MYRNKQDFKYEDEAEISSKIQFKRMGIFKRQLFQFICEQKLKYMSFYLFLAGYFKKRLHFLFV